MAQRYVIIKGQVFAWEEKAPFVPSGRSIAGAFECSTDRTQLRCHECGKWFKQISGRHLLIKHGMSRRDYSIKHGLRQASAPVAPVSHARRRDLGNVEQLRASGPVLKGGDQLVSRPRIRRAAAESRNLHGVCAAQVVFKLRNLIIDAGHVITSKDVPAAFVTAVQKRCGSWNAGVRAAGFEPNASVSDPRYSRELIIEIMRDFYVLNRRLPRERDWGTGRLPAYSTAAKYFGSIAAALQEAGLGLVSSAAD